MALIYAINLLKGEIQRFFEALPRDECFELNLTFGYKLVDLIQSPFAPSTFIRNFETAMAYAKEKHSVPIAKALCIKGKMKELIAHLAKHVQGYGNFWTETEELATNWLQGRSN